VKDDILSCLITFPVDSGRIDIDLYKKKELKVFTTGLRNSNNVLNKQIGCLFF
jgi:hypothetical protein